MMANGVSYTGAGAYKGTANHVRSGALRSTRAWYTIGRFAAVMCHTQQSVRYSHTRPCASAVFILHALRSLRTRMSCSWMVNIVSKCTCSGVR
jgi:hypothetical protein